MGALIQCVKCQTKLQQLGCPHCQKSMYFIPDKPYQYAKPILCYNCQSGFQHFNCGRCNQPQFSRGQKFNPCQPQICNLCMLVTYVLNCPSCKIAQFRQEYHPFKVDECQNQKCKKYHSFFECPGCKKLNEQVYAFREMENGRKQCQHCKLQFTAFGCVQCKNKVIQNKIKEEDIYDNSKINVVCQKCNNNQLGVYCCNCKTCFGVDDVFSKTATCDTCKTENVLKLGKESDAKLGASQLKMEKKSSGVVQDDRLLCKICQDKQANHIFINCGHLVTCDDCSKLDLKKTCPLCRTKGELQITHEFPYDMTSADIHADWTVNFGSANTFIDSCYNGNSFGIFGINHVARRTYDLSAVPHFYIYFGMELDICGSWDTERFIVQENGIYVRQQTTYYLYAPYFDSFKHCSQSTWDIGTIDRVAFGYGHTASSSQILLTSNLNELRDNESWAVNHFWMSVISCHDSCGSCGASESYDMCMSCPTNSVFYDLDGDGYGVCLCNFELDLFAENWVCVSNCSAGRVKNYITRTCDIQCDENCTTCNEDQCINCSAGFFILNGKCVTSCPFYTTLSGSTCVDTDYNSAKNPHVLYEKFNDIEFTHANIKYDGWVYDYDYNDNGYSQGSYFNYNCNGQSILLGQSSTNIRDANGCDGTGCYLKNQFTDLPPHYKYHLKYKVLKLDNPNDGNSQIFVDGSNIDSIFFTATDGTSDVCGRPEYNDEWHEMDFGEAFHTSNTLNFQINPHYNGGSYQMRIFGINHVARRTYDLSAVPHFYIYFGMELDICGSWDTERFIVQENGIYVRQQTTYYLYAPYFDSFKHCSQSTWDIGTIDRVAFGYGHTASSSQILLTSNLNELRDNESWAQFEDFGYDVNSYIDLYDGFALVGQKNVGGDWRIQRDGYPNTRAHVETCLVDCDATCATCQGGQNKYDCQTCNSPRYLQYNEYSDINECVTTCNDGKYAQSTPSRLCVDCPVQCTLCTSSTSCSSCAYGYYYDTTTSSCVTTCPDTYYAEDNGRTCQPCDSECYTCNGPSSKQCILCTSSPTQLYMHFDNQCYQNCPQGYFNDNTSKNCQICPTGCYTCSDLSTCSECIPGYYLHNNNCLLTCPSGYYDNPDPYNSCDPCDTICNTCDYTAPLQCTSCNSGYFLYNNYCVQCDDLLGFENDPTDSTNCLEICGDGLVVSTQFECDDGNTENGDGCSSTCTIEEGYTCEGGNQYQLSICQKNWGYINYRVTESDSQETFYNLEQNYLYYFTIEFEIDFFLKEGDSILEYLQVKLEGQEKQFPLQIYYDQNNEKKYIISVQFDKTYRNRNLQVFFNNTDVFTDSKGKILGLCYMLIADESEDEPTRFDKNQIIIYIYTASMVTHILFLFWDTWYFLYRYSSKFCVGNKIFKVNNLREKRKLKGIKAIKDIQIPNKNKRKSQIMEVAYDDISQMSTKRLNLNELISPEKRFVNSELSGNNSNMNSNSHINSIITSKRRLRKSKLPVKNIDLENINISNFNSNNVSRQDDIQNNYNFNDKQDFIRQEYK
ncbi:Insulin-like growth factor binding protein, N-terminal [Pseudocohnilembus persalinus]|uniref:Insulin-like growth factor binding protein, N-terminal n=1 Tax=Pseudocohnilembus persalinus TaxID=266149 RepID=A0A0V0QYT5_PSEPJ|nr:Insulin-like growth factor binding protein, N-terminal [Pseudocohnilembus persalinus]|eukprot:KRX07487.1 Insulin-like growth factor binding protein, N-terminal [Pseudocohnilembus persalinus]